MTDNKTELKKTIQLTYDQNDPDNEVLINERGDRFDFNPHKHEGFADFLHGLNNLNTRPQPTEEEINQAIKNGDIEVVIFESAKGEKTEYLNKNDLFEYALSFHREGEKKECCPNCNEPRPDHYEGEGSCESCGELNLPTQPEQPEVKEESGYTLKSMNERYEQESEWRKFIPKAMPGDEVRFVNFRVKKDSVVIGKVVHVETHWADEDEFEYVYDIKPWDKNYRVRVRDIMEVVRRYNPDPLTDLEQQP